MNYQAAEGSCPKKNSGCLAHFPDSSQLPDGNISDCRKGRVPSTEDPVIAQQVQDVPTGFLPFVAWYAGCSERPGLGVKRLQLDPGSTIDHLLWARSYHLSGPTAKQGRDLEVGDNGISVMSWNHEHLTIHI